MFFWGLSSFLFQGDIVVRNKWLGLSKIVWSTSVEVFEIGTASEGNPSYDQVCVLVKQLWGRGAIWCLYVGAGLFGETTILSCHECAHFLSFYMFFVLWFGILIWVALYLSKSAAQSLVMNSGFLA